MKKAAYAPKQIKNLRALKDHVLVTEMEFGDRQLSSGIMLLSDDGKSDGIRPRWARVFAVGPEQEDVKVGQWILVAHGRWTRANDIEVNGEKKSLRRVDNNDILMVSDTEPGADDTVSTSVNVQAKSL
jgi:co-chaperonin GroES (HSP10)